MHSKQNTKIKYTALLIDGTTLGVGEDTNKWFLVTHKKDRVTTKTFSRVSRLLRHINRRFKILPVIFPLNVEITRKTGFDDTKHNVVVFNEV